MKRALALALLTLLAVPPLARAADDDKIMGVYQGAFTGAWKDRTLRAEVIGLSENTWRAQLYVNGAKAAAESARSRPSKAKFAGEIDLGAQGGVKPFDATIEGEVFKGEIGGADGAFELKRVMVKPPTLGQAAPAGAVVLFDGKDTSAWRRDPEGWCVQGDGSMEVCGSNLVTRQEFGDMQIHLEFMTPYMPKEREQGRGNSGFYVHGRYEVQVLDSFGEDPKWDYCGGIYKVSVPLKNASLPPLTWQTYDATFRAPRFDAAGNKTENARITVVHNGETIHDNLELPNATPGGVSDKEAAQGPIMLQDHHNNVRFRNVWVKPL